MRPLRLFSLAIVPFALAACDADPVRPPPVPDSGPQLATAAADACAVDGPVTVREIHPPGATTSRAVAVNDLGEAVVVAEPGGAFLWSATAGFRPVPIEFPNAVNNQSQVVGTNGTGAASVPVLWSPGGGLQPLALPTGYTSGVAEDINDAGVVVGGIRAPAPFGLLPARWVSGVPDFLSLEDVTFFFELTGAQAVSDDGEVLGNGFAESFGFTLLWPSDGSAPQRLVTPGADGGLAYDINDAGRFVATTVIEVAGQPDAYLWTPGTGFLRIDPDPDFATTAVALNDAASVVGDRYPADDIGIPLGPSRAYRWTSSEGLTLLPLLAGTDTSSAADINEAGVIVGRSNSIAVLWAPASSPAAALTALADLVRELAASGAIAQADAAPLLAKLANAERLLAADRLAAARGLVNAFANQVRALQSAGRIGDAAAESLLDAVTCFSSSL